VYAETRSRHARYYSAWLSLMNEKLKGSEQLAALDALRAETQNLYDAWRWLIEQRDLERLHGVLPAMVLFHEMCGRPVEAQVVVRVLLDMLRALGYAPDAGADAAAKPDVGLLALALAALRHFSQMLEYGERANLYRQESLDIAQELPDSQEKAFTLMLNSVGAGILTPQQSLDLWTPSWRAALTRPAWRALPGWATSGGEPCA
jgi:hypothetical protein